MLKDTPKNTGGAGKQGGGRNSGSKKEPLFDEPLTLAEMGLDKKTSKLAQDVAKSGKIKNRPNYEAVFLFGSGPVARLRVKPKRYSVSNGQACPASKAVIDTLHIGQCFHRGAFKGGKLG